MPIEQAGAPVVEPENFQDARDLAVQKGKAETVRREDEQVFDTKVEGAVDHLLGGQDLAALEREVLGEQVIIDKINGWRGGMTPENTAKLDEYRKAHSGQAAFGEPVEKTPPVGVDDAAQPAITPEEPTRMTPQPTPATLAVEEKPATSVDKGPAKFNPVTGEALAEGLALKFDPHTGQPIDLTTPGANSEDLDLRFTQFKENLMAEIKKEHGVKLEDLQVQLDSTNEQLVSAHDERKSLIDQRDQAKVQRREEMETRQGLEFQYAAKKAGIPDDMADLAYEYAKSSIVNDPKKNPNFNNADPSKRTMSYEQIFGVMQQDKPSLFSGARAQPDPNAIEKGHIAPLGTGKTVGGNAGDLGLPASRSKDNQSDNFDDAKTQLKKLARARFGSQK